MSDTLQFRFDLPHECLADELAAVGPAYQLGPASVLPPDPDAVEARFIEPVSHAISRMSRWAWQ